MENLEKEMTPQEWEIKVKEAVADGDELQLLEMAKGAAIKFLSALEDVAASIWVEGKSMDMNAEVLRLRIARVAVLLDVLQLRYGDCSAEEMAFLQSIDACLEEK